MRPSLAPLASALLLLSAALAGCSGDEPPASGDGPGRSGRTGDEPEERAMDQTSGFGWAMATGTPETDVQFASSNGDSRDVGDRAALLVADVAWTCASPTCDLHAYLCSPDEADAQGCAIHAMGPSPLSLSAEDPEEGEWTVVLFSSGPTADVVGTITMTES